MKRKLIVPLLIMTLTLSSSTLVWAGEPSGVGTEISQTGNDEAEQGKEEQEQEETIIPDVPVDTSKNDDVVSEDVSKKSKESITENQNLETDGKNTSEEEIPIDETHFPDVAFREMVSGCDKDGNGQLSQSERDSVEIINTFGIGNDLSWRSAIQVATGIEYFTNLKELSCGGQLENLDVSKNVNLTVLKCSNAQLKDLDVSKNINLERLECIGNQITSLDVTNNLKLRFLSCNMNPLGKLDVSKNLNLESLICPGTQLTSLDVSNNVKLDYLQCSSNPLTSLDVNNNVNLSVLICRGNQLTNIDVSNNRKLVWLSCRNNQLQNLEIANNQNLEALDCAYNQLSHLDVSNNAKLDTLWCENNQLEELNVNQNAELAVFKCYGNHLLGLDLSDNKKMPRRSGVGTEQNDILARDLEGAYVTPQSVSKTVTKVNGKWSFDLAAIIGKDNIGRVSLVTEGAELSDSGVVTFSGDKAPSELEYTYDTKNPAEATPMTVQVALSGVKDQTKEEVSIDTSGLDLDRICREHNIDPSKAEIVLSQETPAQKDTEKLTQKVNANGYSFVNAYEIFMSLYSDGNKVADITENFGKLILTLQAGKDYAEYNAAVYQLHNGEEIISHEGLTVDAEGMVTISVDKFSTFAVAVKNNSSVNNPEQKPDNIQTSTNTPNNSTPTFSPSGNNTTNVRSVKTGDSLEVVLWSLLCIMSVSVVVLLARKKYYKHS